MKNQIFYSKKKKRENSKFRACHLKWVRQCGQTLFHIEWNKLYCALYKTVCIKATKAVFSLNLKQHKKIKEKTLTKIDWMEEGMQYDLLVHVFKNTVCSNI